MAQILPRVSTYLQGYLLAFSNVVAEEEYDQQVENILRTEFSNGTFHLSRKLKSEFLLVRLDGPGVWVPFRDVMAVDGKPVRERRERIQKLLIEDPVKTLRDSQRLADESARYDLGSIYRTVNMPTLALVFLMPQHLSNFIFTPGADEVVDGVTATRIDYQETGHPDSRAACQVPDGHGFTRLTLGRWAVGSDHEDARRHDRREVPHGGDCHLPPRGSPRHLGARRDDGTVPTEGRDDHVHGHLQELQAVRCADGRGGQATEALTASLRESVMLRAIATATAVADKPVAHASAAS